MSDFETKIGTTFLDYEDSYIYNTYHRYSHERAVNKLLPASKGGSVADLGCAGGTYYNLLKKKGYKTIYGIDLSAHRLEKAKEKGYITYNTYAQNLPFENSSLDAAFSIDMLVHVLKKSDRFDIFKEVSRVLKPGGIFVFSIASKKAYVKGDYGIDKQTVYSSPDGIINDYCSLMDFNEVNEFAGSTGFTTGKIFATQFDFKALRFTKKLTKDFMHYGFTLPFLDLLLAKSFLKEYGKAVFFRLIKK